MSTALATRVFTCPTCAAPLPAAELGDQVTCPFCHAQTRLEQDGAALRLERASRAEAEALYATLGQPPSCSQRVAAFLVKPKFWIFGVPIIGWGVGAVTGPLRDGIAALWERAFAERLSHVLGQAEGWLFEQGFTTVALCAVLVWSLFGERVDARRALQAALASKPPATPGGSALCRHCDAPLTLPPGALGTRCDFCGADNLVRIPAAWAAKAKKIRGSLRLGIAQARERTAQGRRQVLRAAAWRIPLVLVLLAGLGVPAWRRHSRAGWRDYQLRPDHPAGIYLLAVHDPHDYPRLEMHALPDCDNARAVKVLAHDAILSTTASDWCEPGFGCTAVAMLPLQHGERLRLQWTTPGPLAMRLAIAPRGYLGGAGVMAEWYGDELDKRVLQPADGDYERPIPLSGWYKLELRGAEGLAIAPCVTRPESTAGDSR